MKNSKQNKIEELSWHVTHFAVLRNSILPYSHFVLFPLANINRGDVLTLKQSFRLCRTHPVCAISLFLKSTWQNDVTVPNSDWSFTVTRAPWFHFVTCFCFSGSIGVETRRHQDWSAKVYHLCLHAYVVVYSTLNRSSWFKLSDSLLGSLHLLRLAIHHY